MDRADILAAVAGYDEETTAAWLVSLACYAWPEDCPLAPPPGYWEAQSDLEQHRLAKPLWRILHEMTSQEAFSKAWWMMKLGRTEGEWQDWWDRQQAHIDGTRP